jgi:hypothetical protein
MAWETRKQSSGLYYTQSLRVGRKVCRYISAADRSPRTWRSSTRPSGSY